MNACYGFFVLPESLGRDKRMAFAWKRANPVGSLVLLRSHHELFGLATVAFFGYLAHAVLPNVSVLYMGYRYGWGTTAIGLMLAGATGVAWAARRAEIFARASNCRVTLKPIS